MLRKFSWVLALGLLLPAAVKAEFHQGDFELTIAGSGANGPDFDGVTAAVNGSLGYFLTKEIEVGVRQSLGYTDVNTSGSWTGSTRAAADFHFDLGAWQPFIGGNIGFVYGDNVNDTWEAAPEAGVKYFVNSTTFIFVMAEYQWFFDNNSGDNGFKDGQFLYTLGLGFRW